MIFSWCPQGSKQPQSRRAPQAMLAAWARRATPSAAVCCLALRVPARSHARADVLAGAHAGDRRHLRGADCGGPPVQARHETLAGVTIMREMRDGGHIDPGLFEVFVQGGVHLDYARRFLDVSQIDV